MKEYFLDSQLYNTLLQYLNNQHFIDKVGLPIDCKFLYQDQWLRDTAVIEQVVKRNGMWEIHLIFAHYQNPNLLIKRVITKVSNLKKAEQQGHYMKRLAAKDQRGTLKISLADFNLCSN